MSDDLDSLDVFRFKLPVWILARRDDPGIIRAMQTVLYGELLAIFTDEDLAQRFIEDAGIGDLTPGAIARKGQMLTLLSWCQQKGIQYVGIDCPTAANPRKETGRYPPIQKVIDAARTLPDDPESGSHGPS